MKYTRLTLNQLLLDNGIEASSTNKEQMLFIAFENGLLKREDLFDPPIEKKPIGRPRKEDRNKIILTNTETGETISFDSYYKAKLVTGFNSEYFNRNNGKLLDGYKIEVINPTAAAPLLINLET